MTPSADTALLDRVCTQGCSVVITQGQTYCLGFCELGVIHGCMKCFRWCFGKGLTCAPQERWRPGGRLRPPPPAKPQRCPTGYGSRPVSCCPSRPARTPPHPAVKASHPHHVQPYIHSMRATASSNHHDCIHVQYSATLTPAMVVAPEYCTSERGKMTMACPDHSCPEFVE